MPYKFRVQILSKKRLGVYLQSFSLIIIHNVNCNTSWCLLSYKSSFNLSIFLWNAFTRNSTVHSRFKTKMWSLFWSDCFTFLECSRNTSRIQFTNLCHVYLFPICYLTIKMRTFICNVILMLSRYIF